MMKYQTIFAPILAGLGGIWMLISGAMIHRGWGMMPMHSQWGMGHMLWGRGMMGSLWGWWPWVSTLAGAIVLVSAIMMYLAPQYRRSLGITILVMAVLNLVFGMGGIFASILAMLSGILALSHHPSTEQ